MKELNLMMTGGVFTGNLGLSDLNISLSLMEWMHYDIMVRESEAIIPNLFVTPKD